jgi:hypothetical protein
VQGANAASQSFTVTNSGGGTLSYSISDDQAWLSCSPASWTSTGEADIITVTYSTSALAVGPYTATITVSGAPAASQTIAVALTVTKPGKLKVSAAALSASCKVGANPAAASFTVANEGVGTLGYALADGSAWMDCTPGSGDVTAELDAVAVNFSASSLAAGTYSGAITVTAADAENSPVTIPVTLKVTTSGGGGGGGGGGGCSLAAGPVSTSSVLGWLVPYLGLAAAYALSRLTRRRRAQ